MIGIFDSGLGGLTVLKEIKRVLPEYDYIYFGDTLHVPYGNRSDKAIFELTKNACEYLFDHGCTLIIIACNTASAKALRKLQQEYLLARPAFAKATSGRQARQVSSKTSNINILGVIRPVAEEFARMNIDKIGLIGTRGTINSGAYETELKIVNEKFPPKADSSLAKKISGQSTPLLVPLIEEGWGKRMETKSILRYYLRPLKAENVKALILGCTHYPLLIKEIRGIMGSRCRVPNPAEIVANSLKDYLSRHPEIESALTKNGRREYLVTDLNDNFKRQAQRFLQEAIIISEVEA